MQGTHALQVGRRILQGFSGKPVKTLQYAAADLQGMDAVPRAKLGASRE